MDIKIWDILLIWVQIEPPTVQACNEAYGFDAGSISGGITLGPHDSNRFMINVYYTTPVDLRTILKDTDPINCV